MKLGGYSLIKNESQWIGPHLMAWLPSLGQIVLADGNSTDGTLETIRLIRDRHPFGQKITLIENCDPKDLQDDYVRVQNLCLRSLKTEFATFLHPDFFPISGAETLDEKLGDGLAYTHGMKSYAGEPGESYVYEILDGRAKRWKNIMRLRNPDLGLHYFGHYGAHNEDMYFKEITGDHHEFLGTNFQHYPFKVEDSGLAIAHFSDVRAHERRLGRMVSCLVNQGHSKEEAVRRAPDHPRVNFDSRDGFVFNKTEYPEAYTKAVAEFENFKKGALSNV